MTGFLSSSSLAGPFGSPAGHHADHGQRDPEAESALFAGPVDPLLDRFDPVPAPDGRWAKEVVRGAAGKGRQGQTGQKPSERWRRTSAGEIVHLSRAPQSGRSAGDGRNLAVRCGPPAVLHRVPVDGRLQFVRGDRLRLLRGQLAQWRVN